MSKCSLLARVCHVAAAPLPRAQPGSFEQRLWRKRAHGRRTKAWTYAAPLTGAAPPPPRLQVGYCQGLNFVASTLLLATGRDAERAFWLLVALLDQVLLRDMYAPYLPGFQIEMKALGKLVHKKLPRLHRGGGGGGGPGGTGVGVGAHEAATAAQVGRREREEGQEWVWAWEQLGVWRGQGKSHWCTRGSHACTGGA